MEPREPDGVDGAPARPAAAPLVGIALKPQHFRAILDDRPAVGWFELHTENLMGPGGPLHRHLREIRADYPFSLHGVGLSLGSAGGIDDRHLARVCEAVERYEPFLVSEHLAWSAHDGTYLADLLPLPCTEEALDIVAENVDRVQSALRRAILVENPSHYGTFVSAEMSEPEFLNRLAARTGCRILLDVNNVQVTSVNLDRDAEGYVRATDPAHIGEIHLAGHSERRIGDQRLLIDDHASPVSPPVWRLYELALDHVGNLPTLIEWDGNIPALPILLEQAEQATRRMTRHFAGGTAYAAAG